MIIKLYDLDLKKIQPLVAANETCPVKIKHNLKYVLFFSIHENNVGIKFKIFTLVNSL